MTVATIITYLLGPTVWLVKFFFLSGWSLVKVFLWLTSPAWLLAAIVGALTHPADALGLEARVTIYAGRPVRAGDLGLPAVVERNQIVPISFLSGGLAIKAEGRALARGGVGDVIRVMNLASRTTVSGRIAPDGQVVVGLTP